METFLFIVFIIYVVYWFATMESRETQKLERQKQTEDLHTRRTQERNEKITALAVRFGQQYSMLGKTIVSKSNRIPWQDDTILNYAWKKILIDDVTEYPTVKGKIIDSSSKNDSQNPVGKYLTINLLNSNIDLYIDLNEFKHDLQKANNDQCINKLKSELYGLNESKKTYIKEQTLWREYYKGLPSEFYDNMTGLEFEKYIENLLTRKGYKVFRTKATGDQGVDIVAEDSYKKKIAIQTKKYKNKVGNSAVQEVVAGKRYYQCAEAWVITNSSFTESATHLAKANRVRLIDGFEMTQLFKDVETQIRTIPVFNRDRYEQIKLLAEKLYPVNESGTQFMTTPYDFEIQNLNREIARLGGLL